jgi:hypothetical protein
MAVSDIMEDTYECPHCKGKILLSRQIKQDGNFGSVYLYHIDEDGDKEQLEWIKTEV